MSIQTTAAQQSDHTNQSSPLAMDKHADTAHFFADNSTNRIRHTPQTLRQKGIKTVRQTDQQKINTLIISTL